ncbi:MAG: YybS family protein [Desulfobacterium sp.]|nr:YybS family protein [Desulfobacterium sp.]
MIRDCITGVSVSLLIFSATLYLPLLGFFLALILPMPVTFYRLKLGRNMGALIMAIVCCVIAGVTGGVSLDVLFFGALLLTGFFLGEFIEMHVPVEKVGLYTCLATMGTCLLVLLLYSITAGQDLFSMVSDYVAANLEMTLSLYSGMGVPQESIDLVSRSIDTIHYVMVRIMPALFTMMIMFVVWVNILSIKTLLMKKGIRIAQLDGLDRWRAPEKLVWLAIAFGLLLLVPVSTLKIVGLNCIFVLMPVYFFQGIAVVSFVFEKRRFPGMLRFFIYSIIAIQQIFLFVVVGLGFFDTWIDFRKLGAVGDGKEQN